MNFTRAKILMIAIFFLAIFFFSNDFGLIDVEKASIVTAVAIDKSGDEYEVSLQIAVPEANSGNTNAKVVVSGKGKTVAEAIGDVTSTTGWYQKLAFCNMIIIGEDLLDTNVMNFLDYFSKSLKIQGSALLAGVEGNAKDLLTTATPLDNISSFSLQKIILQKSGMESDVLSVDIKTFSIGYYSRTASSYMPLVKTIKQKEEDKTLTASTNTGGKTAEQSGSKEDNKVTFKATETILFKNGKRVGLLTEEETLATIYVKESKMDTAIIVNDVLIDGQKVNYMLNVLKNKPKISVDTDNGNVTLKIKQDVYVKIADETSSDKELSNTPAILVPKEVTKKAKEILEKNLLSLIQKCKDTRTDILKIDEKLYRYHHEKYDELKDFWPSLSTDVNITVHGQRAIRTAEDYN